MFKVIRLLIDEKDNGMKVDLKILIGVIAIIVPLFIFNMTNASRLTTTIHQLDKSVTALTVQMTNVERVVFKSD